MADGKVIYASGVSARTAEILRAFAAKNGLTLNRLMDILANIVVAVPTERLFMGKAAELDPRFEQFDIMLSTYMEDKFPEEYRKAPLLRRLFGKMYKPVTHQDLERIDARLDEQRLSGEEVVGLTDEG